MRALVLSGGGSRGAFQVGVVKRLAELGHRWDVVAGVSVGAINAVNMAMYAPAEQRLGALNLERFWCEIEGDRSIYTGWFWGPLAALSKGGLYDTTPLERFLRARFDHNRLKASGVRLFVGAVDLRSGKYVFATEKSADPIKWVMASAAFPGAFPPVEIGGTRYVDGGVRDTTPISDVLKAGATEVDVVLCNPEGGDDTPWSLAKAGSAVEVGLRAAEIMADEVFLTDLASLRRQSKVRHRVYAPQAPWTVGPLTFDPKEIRRMIDVGYGIP